MPNALNPFRFLVIVLAGWMNQKQQHAIEYLREENRVGFGLPMTSAVVWQRKPNV